MLAPGQVSIRGLTLGPATPYRVLPGFDPFSRAVRADQGGARAWAHGSWSGAEWADEAVVPVPVEVAASDREPGGWATLHQPLAAAFAPVGDSGEQVELRWRLGATEYVMFGRPRGVRVRVDYLAVGRSTTQAAFVAPDPRIYSGELHEVVTGLPTQTGGLTAPLTVPFVISGVLDGGREELVNAGTTDSGLAARIDGPVVAPRLVVQRPDGQVQSIRFDLNLGAGQWLDVDTTARTALLNGLPEASQRGRAAWDIDPYPLAPGVNVLRFAAGDYNETAAVTVWWRDAWW